MSGTGCRAEAPQPQRSKCKSAWAHQGAGSSQPMLSPLQVPHLGTPLLRHNVQKCLSLAKINAKISFIHNRILSLHVCISFTHSQHPNYQLFIFVKYHVPASCLLTGETRTEKLHKSSWESTCRFSPHQEFKGCKKEHK